MNKGVPPHTLLFHRFFFSLRDQNQQPQPKTQSVLDESPLDSLSSSLVNSLASLSIGEKSISADTKQTSRSKQASSTISATQKTGSRSTAKTPKTPKRYTMNNNNDSVDKENSVNFS